mmetsp:Transcript_13964/g.43644  ORF Transcript_13964/g.43644 Transcript_13964/m.43644 type:complete len:88 (+) Transcript_13964:752-1015(+)
MGHWAGDDCGGAPQFSVLTLVSVSQPNGQSAWPDRSWASSRWLRGGRLRRRRRHGRWRPSRGGDGVSHEQPGVLREQVGEVRGELLM